MDWIGLQFKLRSLHDEFFCAQEWTEEKIESARANDTGDFAKSVDAVIRQISRGGGFMGLTPDERDILAIRLDWAWQLALKHGPEPFKKPEDLEDQENEVEALLIDQWHNEGRTRYQPRRGIFQVGREPASVRIAPCVKLDSSK